MNRDTAYLAHIHDAIAKIEAFVSELDVDAFKADGKTQSAVILQFMLIGELAKKVSAETRATVELPWKEIAGFRDRAIHDYYEVDLDIVWQTIIEDIPFLKKRLLKKD